MPSTLDIVFYLFLVASYFVYGYVVYTAVAISRSLSSRVYRNQALGLAAVAIVTMTLTTWVTLGPSTSAVLTGLAYIAQFLGTWMALALGFYYYVDASIVAARVTDPLFRDTLHWTRLRLVFWAGDIGVAALLTITGAVGYASFASGPPIFGDLLSIPFFIVLPFSAAVVLPIAARRSKDGVLRRQLNWFAVYVIVFLGLWILSSALIPAADQAQAQKATGILALACVYFLYRSAASLVPMYKFNTERGKSG